MQTEIRPFAWALRYLRNTAPPSQAQNAICMCYIVLGKVETPERPLSESIPELRTRLLDHVLRLEIILDEIMVRGGQVHNAVYIIIDVRLEIVSRASLKLWPHLEAVNWKTKQFPIQYQRKVCHEQSRAILECEAQLQTAGINYRESEVNTFQTKEMDGLQ